jgi:hypothetical protein
VELRAGPLSAIFAAGDLRRIRLGNSEIVRRIYVAVRDHNWGTVPNRISNLSIRTGPDSFDIRYDVENRAGEIDFRWSGRIEGGSRGDIIFAMRGTALTTFRKNRLGFCVLHPIHECAGRPCSVTGPDGVSEEGQFPSLIAPYQPFRNFTEIAYGVNARASIRIRFKGEVFEMEDQRNWTDASFKTYCTPLRMPFPVEIPAGTLIEQTVGLTLQRVEHHSVEAPASSKALHFSFNREAGKPLPALGLAVNTEVPELDSGQIGLLRLLNLDHLRVDLDLARAAWRPILDRAAREAGQLAVPLEAAIILPGSGTPQLRLLADYIAARKPEVRRWLVFNRVEKSTSSHSIRLVRDILAALFPQTPLVSGTNAFFAELNRKRPEPGVGDGICYSISPQVHAFDNDTLVENLAAQGDTVESARHFAGGLPIYVSPVTLRPRFNPDATGPEPEPVPGDLPPTVDARQMSLFGAAWTIGSLKYLAEAAATGITYYETCGWRGVMEAPCGSPLPDRFPSIPGGVFPLFHVLADAAEFKGGEVLPSQSTAPLLMEGLVMRRAGRLCILLANMGCERRLVSVATGDRVREVRIRLLDENSAEQAMRDPRLFRSESAGPIQVTGGCVSVDLGPYTLARLDTVAGSS